MKTIAVVAQKGGVGKTTIANEIAFSFDRTGTPISTYDLDGQGGGAHGTRKNPEAVVRIVDTPGQLTKQVKDVIQASDLVIVPTGSTGLDVIPLTRIQEVIQANISEDAKLLFVVNRMTRWSTSQEFLQWFNKREIGYAVTLPESEYFRRAVGTNSSVIEIAPKNSTAWVDTMKLVNVVRELLGLEKEAI